MLSQSQRPWRPAMQELRTYNHLFSIVDPDKRGLVCQNMVWPLLKSTKLHAGYLEKIWSLADSTNRGEITRREFHIMMKLVSIAQSDRSIKLENLHMAAPLPSLDGIDVSDLTRRNSGSDRSTVLTYSPQATLRVDSILTKENERSKSHSVEDSSSDDDDDDSDESVDLVSRSLSTGTSVFLMNDDNWLEIDRVSLTNPQLRQSNLSSPTSQISDHSLGPVASNTAGLSINTSIASIDTHGHSNVDIYDEILNDEANQSGSESGSISTLGAQNFHSAVSIDSVTELLAQIDFIITSGKVVTPSMKYSTVNGSYFQHKEQINSASAKCRELKDRMSQLEDVCTEEAQINQELACRLESEESQIRDLNEQIERAQRNIAYVAQQRTQMVERLQKVQEQHKLTKQRMEQTTRDCTQCTDDITKLDNKMFGMERKMMQMQRRMKKSNQGTYQQQQPPEDFNTPGAGYFSSSGYRSDSMRSTRCSRGSVRIPEANVKQYYESAKRSRISSVFHQQPAANANAIAPATATTGYA